MVDSEKYINASSADDVGISLIATLRLNGSSLWRLLVKRYEHHVVSICESILANSADVEDATQETFLKIFRYSKTFKPEHPRANAQHWIGQIARHEALKIRNRLQRRRCIPIGFQEVEKSYTDENDQTNLVKSVQRSLNLLPRRTRDSISLYFDQGMSQAKIAEHFKCDQSTVSDRIRKGLRQIRTQVQVDQL